MKKFILTKLAVLCLLAGLYSCNNSKAEFSFINMDLYVTEYNGTYTPYAWFRVINGQLSKGEIYKNNLPVMGYSPAQNFYEMEGRYESGSSLSAVNGTYVFTATSIEGDVAQLSYTLNFQKTLGDFEFTDFHYRDRKISFKIPKQVDEATCYGFYYHFVQPTAQYPNSAALLSAYDVYNSASGEQTIASNFDTSSTNYIPSDDVSVLVYPFVGETTSGFFLMKLGEPKTLYKNDTSFREDAE